MTENGYIPLLSDPASQEDISELLVPQEGSYYETHPGDIANLSIHLDGLSFASSNSSLLEFDESRMLTAPVGAELLQYLDRRIATVPPRLHFPLFESPEASTNGSADISDASDTSIPSGLACPICDPRRQIRVTFKECSHGTCRTCAMRLWRSKWEHAEFPPAWFSCPFCRAEIHHVGVLTDGGSGNRGDALVETVEHGGIEFTVRDWLNVQRWVELQRENRAVEFGMGESILRWLLETTGEDEGEEVEGEEGWAGGSSPPASGYP